jgi:acyl-CoA thioester hydrolase
MTDSANQTDIDLTDRAVFAVWSRDLVRYRDIDPNGHVNNGAVNQFFEDGRIGLRDQRMAGVQPNLLTGFAVVNFNATYRAPISYPAEVEIGTVVLKIGGSSFHLGQGVFHEDRCAATATVIQVYFDPKTGKSNTLPDPVRSALEGAMVRA